MHFEQVKVTMFVAAVAVVMVEVEEVPAAMRLKSSMMIESLAPTVAENSKSKRERDTSPTAKRP